MPLGFQCHACTNRVSVLAVTDHAPSGGEDLLDLVGPEKHIRGIAGYAIYGRTQGVQRTKFVHHVSWAWRRPAPFAQLRFAR